MRLSTLFQNVWDDMYALLWVMYSTQVEELLLIGGLTVSVASRYSKEVNLLVKV